MEKRLVSNSLQTMSDKKTRIAVVVACHLAHDSVKNYHYKAEDKVKSIQSTVAAHRHFNPGVEYTLIIVDNDSQNSQKDILKTLGDEYLLNPKNYGYGFAGWKHAWETFKDRFDYYLFTEDDWAPAKDGWLAEIVEKFLSDGKIGAVGNFIEVHFNDGSVLIQSIWETLHLDKDYALQSFDGGWTFTSTRILQEVEARGGLKVYPTEYPGNSNGTLNELIFQYPIVELGYELYGFAQHDYYHIHGSELWTGDVTSGHCEKVAPILPPMAGYANQRVKEIYAWM